MAEHDKGKGPAGRVHLATQCAAHQLLMFLFVVICYKLLYFMVKCLTDVHELKPLQGQVHITKAPYNYLRGYIIAVHYIKQLRLIIPFISNSVKYYG